MKTCWILMKLEFLDRFSKKSSNIKFHQNPSSGSQVVRHGQPDGRGKANSPVTFRNCVNVPKNRIVEKKTGTCKKCDFHVTECEEADKIKFSFATTNMSVCEHVK
jgi:hypothetical protein